MLRSRLIVAAIGIPIGVALVVLGGPLFGGAVALLALLGLHEFYTLTRPYRPNLLVGYLAAVACMFGAYFAGAAGLLAGAASVVLLLFFWSLGGPLGDHLVGRMAVTALGVVWLALGFGHMIVLRNLEHGMALTIFAIAVTWINDTFAYGTGRLLGRHRLAPRISPNKTIEGSVGGIVGSVLCALVVKVYAGDWFPARDAVILGLAVGVIGQWGDLFESAVKRDLRVKDSGRLFAGHGGVLDRFDSVLFAVIVTYWGAALLLGGAVGGPL